jgi:hypothetical protein
MKYEAIVLDTNLLLLLIVGSQDLNFLRMHDRFRKYDAQGDYNLLVNFLTLSSSLILTPNTLTETSNLLRQIKSPAKDILSNRLKLFIERYQEIYIPSEECAERSEFLSLGLTDSALLQLTMNNSSGNSILLLTMDLELYIAATMLNLNVINFNQLRKF